MLERSLPAERKGRIRLEPTPDGHYRYHAWNMPLVDGNGSPRVINRDKRSAFDAGEICLTAKIATDYLINLCDYQVF